MMIEEQAVYNVYGQPTSWRSGESYARFGYEYDPNTNNVIKQTYYHRTANDPCTDFTYDSLHRLHIAEYGIQDNNEVFTIDDLGNRDTVNVRDGNDVDYAIDNLTNRYDSVGGNSLTYNAAGSLTKDKDGYEYEYDYENRIVKITKDGNDIAEFAYDALGRRIRKIDSIADETTIYYHNYKWQVLCEYDDSYQLSRLFIYGNYIDEVVFYYDSDSKSYYYYVHDHLYSPAALVHYSSGNVVERYEYDAYGHCQILEPNFAGDPDQESDYGNSYFFTGRRVDILDNGSLKIQYNRNRYYDYYTGRWLTHDPLHYADGMNLYEYARSNPIVLTDPIGGCGADPRSATREDFSGRPCDPDSLYDYFFPYGWTYVPDGFTIGDIVARRRIFAGTLLATVTPTPPKMIAYICKETIPPTSDLPPAVSIALHSDTVVRGGPIPEYLNWYALIDVYECIPNDKCEKLLGKLRKVESKEWKCDAWDRERARGGIDPSLEPGQFHNPGRGGTITGPPEECAEKLLEDYKGDWFKSLAKNLGGR